MKRLGYLIVVWFSLGLATSVGLAWVGAALARPSLGKNNWIVFKHRIHNTMNGWSLIELQDQVQSMRLLRQNPTSWVSKSDDPNYKPPGYSKAWQSAPTIDRTEPYSYLQIVEKETGWPLRCMRVRWL